MSILSQIVGGSSAITGYTQTAVMQTSQSVAVPPGTKRIEALLCGGGSLGGFGGLQIYEIPVTGTSITLNVGLGTNTAAGGETSVVINGAKIAAVGGRFASGGYVGGPPFNKNLLRWSALDEAPRNGRSAGTLAYYYSGAAADTYMLLTPGCAPPTGFDGSSAQGTDAIEGYGGSCGGSETYTGFAGSAGGAGAAGGKGANCSNDPSNAAAGGQGGAGAGGGSGGYYLASGGSPLNGSGANGGDMNWCSVWGLTGFGAGLGGAPYSGAAAGSGGGGGGGGMLSAGTAGAAGTAGGRGNGGAGGNGGGGAGGGPASAVKGGDGFGMLRFYY